MWRSAGSAAVVGLALALAWGLRGEHGHEPGAAMAGAMAGLSLAAVIGNPVWVRAAVIGSATFAIGGALSYGSLIAPAFHGSWEAIGSLLLVGMAWGGLGGLGLGMGRMRSAYRLREGALIGIVLLALWWLVDRHLWSLVTGPGDLASRRAMALILFSACLALALYARARHRDQCSWRLAVAGAVGFGVGFLVAVWVQGAGPRSGLPLDWWKLSEHVIGLCGGIAIWTVASRPEPRAPPGGSRPETVGLLEIAWLFGGIPSWLLANNVHYWVVERAVLPPRFQALLWVGWFASLAVLAPRYGERVRGSRRVIATWSPERLTRLFLGFLWLATGLGCSKTLLGGPATPNPIGFAALALVITGLSTSLRK